MSKQATLERRRAARLADRARRRGARAAHPPAVAARAPSRRPPPCSSPARSPSPAAAARSRAAPATTSSLLAGIPERGGVLGDPKAPLTVTEYVDLQCPVCARAATTTVPALIRDQVRAGKVKLAVRTLHFLGPDSERAARVAAGAERQGRLWAFLEAFYARQGTENSGYVTDGFLRDVVDGRAASTPDARSARRTRRSRPAGCSARTPTPRASASPARRR